MEVTKHKHSFIPEAHGDEVTWVCIAVKGCPEEWEGRPAPAWPEESYVGIPATPGGNTPAQEPLRAEALKAEVRKLADWSRERWDDVRGGDPIARTLNAVFDIIDRAALSGVPVERPETTWYECSKCGYAYPERGGWAHKESTGHWPPADSPVRVPVEPPATEGEP